MPYAVTDLPIGEHQGVSSVRPPGLDAGHACRGRRSPLEGGGGHGGRPPPRRDVCEDQEVEQGGYVVYGGVLSLLVVTPRFFGGAPEARLWTLKGRKEEVAGG